MLPTLSIGMHNIVVITFANFKTSFLLLRYTNAFIIFSCYKIEHIQGTAENIFFREREFLCFYMIFTKYISLRKQVMIDWLFAFI